MKAGTAFLLLVTAFSAIAQPERETAESASRWAGWWLTADQQAQSLFDQGHYEEAAAKFSGPEHIGVAWYLAGEFETAEVILGRAPSAEAAYNRGNALVMLGRYEDAIESYQRALVLRPGWTEAEDNRVIAELRLAALAPPEDDSGGTGGKMEADEVVFDDSGRVSKGGQEESVDAGASMTDDELRAVWLRRVQNKPQDFLRARFNYQLSQQPSDEVPGD